MELFKRIDDNQDKYIKRLAETVAIKSVSAWPEARPEVVRMVEWTKVELEKLGATCELEELGIQADTDNLNLPPVLLGTLGKDPAKKTLLIYGHLDVHPAEKADGWDTEPFVLTEVRGDLYGRGSTDDKGPVLAWINCVEAMQELGQDLPINLKFIFEGMEESGSKGLAELVFSKKDTFLKGVDYVCISDNYWLCKETPSIPDVLTGICYFCVEVACTGEDLHSGLFVSPVHQAMNDLIAILYSLVDVKGKILIPGMYDAVALVPDDKMASYKPIDFEPNEYKADIGVDTLIQPDKEAVLMPPSRYPGLYIHGIEGAFSSARANTVIHRKVIGKFSIRLVPDMLSYDVSKLVKDYIEKVHKDSGSPNAVKVTVEGDDGKPWTADFNHENFVAVRKAVIAAFGVEPHLTREGGSTPVTLTFQEATGKYAMILPCIGQSDDGAHSQNEKISKADYINRVKLLGAYMIELGNAK